MVWEEEGWWKGLKSPSLCTQTNLRWGEAWQRDLDWWRNEESGWGKIRLFCTLGFYLAIQLKTSISSNTFCFVVWCCSDWVPRISVYKIMSSAKGSTLISKLNFFYYSFMPLVWAMTVVRERENIHLAFIWQTRFKIYVTNKTQQVTLTT